MGPPPEGDGEAAAPPGAAVDADGAAVLHDQLTGQGEADPGPLDAATGRAVDAGEAVEYALEVPGRDADPGVGHDHPGSRLAGLDPECDPAVQCVLDRVRQEVEDDLLPHVEVDEDGLVEWPHVDVEAQAGG